MNFLKSDYCNACGGIGYRIEKTIADMPTPGLRRIEYEQCEECEELHDQERRADIMQDIAKGN
jgi:hypothetical protein